MRTGLGAFAGVLLALLAGCSTVAGRRTTLVDGRWVDVAVAGRGTPVVVFESGLGADLSAWSQVLPEVSRFATTFAYSRPGFGASEPASSPRTGRVVVEELRATLRKEGLAPPYVLVGHSLGGLYLQLFARLYPEEIAGLVLVDSSHPAQMVGLRGRPPLSAWTTALRLYMTGARGLEFRGLDATGREVLAAPPLEGRPVVVLNASNEAARRDPLRGDLARLYPGCRERWVESTHDIPRRHPEAVIAAIRDVLKAR